MNKNDLPKDFINLLTSVTAKRARYVIDTILEKGYCTTEDLKNAGYEHAPRAARDVRELGIPLVTGKAKDESGKSIASYTFGNWEEAKKQNQLSKTSGRTQLGEKLKDALINKYGCKCHLYQEEYPRRLLQPDHRIPYEIGGDPENMMDLDRFMLLCPSANRDKSWACEHCRNWVSKNPEMCKSCYYAYPEKYTHVAGMQERRVELIFKKDDIEAYDKITKLAKQRGLSVNDYMRRVIIRFVNK